MNAYLDLFHHWAIANQWWLTGAALILVCFVSVSATRKLAAPATGPVRPVGGRAKSGTAGQRVDLLLTFVAAATATAMSAQGMWNFFEHVIGITDPYVRIGLFTFIELAMFVSALRSRRHRLRMQHRHNALLHELKTAGTQRAEEIRAQLAIRTVDVDGIAVWVLATITGVLSALDTNDLGAAFFRIIAPLIAAWMWERAMVGEVRSISETTQAVRTWLDGINKFLVARGWKQATTQDAWELDTERRLNKLVQALLLVHELVAAETAEADTKAKDKHANMLVKARSKLNKVLLELSARGLLDEPGNLDKVFLRMALMRNIEARTTQESLAKVEFWNGTAAAAAVWNVVDEDAAHDAHELVSTARSMSGERPALTDSSDGERSAVSGVSDQSDRSVSDGDRDQVSVVSGDVSVPASGSERRPVSVPAARVSTPAVADERPRLAAVSGEPRMIGKPGEEQLVFPLVAPGVPDRYAAGWIVLQLMAGREKFGSEVTELFDCKSSSGRRWVNNASAHLEPLKKQLDELRKQHELVSV